MVDLREYHKLEAWFSGKIAGAFSAFDMAALDEGCKRLKKGDIYVEVGTQNGRSAYCAQQFLPEGVKCFAVDITDAATGPDTMSRKDFFAKYLPDWTFIHAPSAEAAKAWKLPIDMMFIDADHSYEGVKLDIESWKGFVKPGSYMYFHDADETSPGVVKAVEELAKEKGYGDLLYYKQKHQNNTSVASVKKL